MEDLDNDDMCDHAECMAIVNDLNDLELIALSQRTASPRYTVFNINLNGCSIADILSDLSKVRFVARVDPVDLRELVASIRVAWYPERLDKNLVTRTNDVEELRVVVCAAIGLGDDLDPQEMDLWVRVHDVTDFDTDPSTLHREE